MTIPEIFDSFITRRLKREKIYSDYGIISDIDVENNTCTVSPVSGDSDRFGVRIFPTDNNSTGIAYIPTDGSTVAFSYTSKTNAFITMFSSLESIVFQGGENGGLVKVAELGTKLNAIENDVNNLKNIFASWVVLPTDGGAALKTAASLWYTNPLVKTVNTDLENNNFKH